MSEGEKRKQDRNVREQQRSQKISAQIKELRQVLTESKVPFKQNKFSILMSVVDYIKQLQNRASLLDSEHRKLVNTIRETSELVNSGFIHRTDDVPDVGNDAEMLYVQGLDYRAIFEQCSFPVGVAALDGRFLMCNSKFERITGLSKQELESETLFGLLATNDVDEVFRALGTLLKGSISEQNKSGGRESGDANGDIIGYCNEDSSADDNGISTGDDGGSTINGGYWSGALSRPNDNVSSL